MSSDVLTDLEAWFRQAPIQLYLGVRIVNDDLFVQTSFYILKQVPEAKIHESAKARLQQHKDFMEQQDCR